MSPAVTEFELKERSVTAVPLGQIKVTGNIRKHFDEKALEELAENVRKVGVLQALIVRRQGDDLTLIAGERRLRAAKMAGLKMVPVHVLICTDDEALEIQAFENLHRKDLGPIEEARAFKLLLDAGKHDVKALAARVSKSEAHVYRAIRLLELPNEILDLIEAGELSPAHGHQIVRVPASDRKRAIEFALEKDWHGDRPTVGRLAEKIEGHLGKRLSDATFPKDKPFAGTIACTGCPSNSGNQGMLFDGAEKGRCLNSPCFDRKTNAVIEAEIEKAKKTGRKILRGKEAEKALHGDEYMMLDNRCHLLSWDSNKTWRQLLKKQKVNIVLVIDEDGDYGKKGAIHEAVEREEAIKAARAGGAKIQIQSTKGQALAALSGRDLSEERKKRVIQKEVAIRAFDKVSTAMRKKDKGAAFWRLIATAIDGHVDSIFFVFEKLGLIPKQGSVPSMDGDALEKYLEAAPIDKIHDLIFDLIVANRLYQNGCYGEDLERACELYGVDLKKLEKEYRAEKAKGKKKA